MQQPAKKKQYFRLFVCWLFCGTLVLLVCVVISCIQAFCEVLHLTLQQFKRLADRLRLELVRLPRKGTFQETVFNVPAKAFDRRWMLPHD